MKCLDIFWRRARVLFLPLLSAGILAVSTGCMSLLKASPAEDAGFIEAPEQMEEGEHINARWLSQKFLDTWEKYDSVIIPPVSTEYLLKTGSWRHIRIFREAKIREDAVEIAASMHSKLLAGFEDGTVKKVTLADTPSPSAIILELALVELVPTDVVRNTAGKVTGFLVPGGGLIGAGSGGSVAFEARVRDSETGELLATAKDRRTAKISPLDLAGVTPYRHVHQNVDDWVDGWFRWFDTESEDQVPLAAPITLKPW